MMSDEEYDKVADIRAYRTAYKLFDQHGNLIIEEKVTLLALDFEDALSAIKNYIGTSLEEDGVLTMPVIKINEVEIAYIEEISPLGQISERATRRMRDRLE